MTAHAFINKCDDYLNARTGTYEQRAARYRMTASMLEGEGLLDTDTVVDVGAGWTEFDYCLRTEFNFKGRYIPVDGGIDGVDLNKWFPPRAANWFVALEILEHLENPYRLARSMMHAATRGVIFSTPNPRTTDVLGMDETHVCEVDVNKMRRLGFRVVEATFYGRFSNGEPDSLFGVWRRP
jgi:hypothetical protein